MDLSREIELHVRSRTTLMVVESVDEQRVLDELTRFCERSERTLLAWDHADHFRLLAGKASPPRAREPLALLDEIEKLPGSNVVVLLDFHQCWDRQPRVIRKLRNLAHRLKFKKTSLIVTMPAGEVPPELEDAAVRVDVPPPAIEQLESILDGLLETPGVRHDLDAEAKQRILRAGLGLSCNQAQRVFARAIVTDGVLDERDVDLIAAQKKQIIRSSGALEYYTPRETIADVGGLGVLKEWLRQRGSAFGREAREYGLPAPKGIALIGIPGTGKSLTAKTVAALWRLPLIRMDIGALFGSLVGQSEENVRRALVLAETVAPCVLWIDEIEKGLATGDNDGGTSMRVLGTILSWMQEKTKPVFTVATANNIAMLPPELLRRGRFDEVFFLDLPTPSEREEIFSVHLRRTGRDPKNYDLGPLVEASDGYVGAEIAQAIIDAMYLAFNDGVREFTTADVVTALHRLVPMSRSQRENIAVLRAWLHEGRAQSASFAETQEAERRFVSIPISPEAE